MSEIQLQPATEEEVSAIAALVNGFAAQNLMLPRTEESILQSLPDWLVALARPEPNPAEPNPAPLRGCPHLLGCGSLVALTEQLVEIRSLAVAPAGQGQGIGRRIVEELVQVATVRGYAQICALTLQESFFQKLGFDVVDRWSISPKLWQDCIYCPKFHHCDEVAVARNLTDRPLETADNAQAAAAPLLKWQAWQPLKLAYRRPHNEPAAARPAGDTRPIPLDDAERREEGAE